MEVVDGQIMPQYSQFNTMSSEGAGSEVVSGSQVVNNYMLSDGTAISAEQALLLQQQGKSLFNIHYLQSSAL